MTRRRGMPTGLGPGDGRGRGVGLQSCTAQRGDGSFCDLPSVPDAPFPICQKHVLDVLRWLEPDRQPEPRVMQVYYARTRDGLVKIGTGSRVADRLAALGVGPDALLATEPGGFPLERMRHQQFKGLLARGHEVFVPDDVLMSHIDMLVDHFGEPVLDNPTTGIVDYSPGGEVSSQPSRRGVERVTALLLARRGGTP